jgi:asparagine synthase (glutamine-hydrolysing)
MCGIAGVQRLESPVDRDVVRAMRDAMVTRGPDDAGLWFSDDGSAALGHRRLAILDPSPAGHQPMVYLDRYVSCFNGEIYNFAELRDLLSGAGYTFRSTSDTEVLLAAYDRWGPGCVERLNGIFAFAIYDQTEHSLFLVRDQVGVKPLYVFRSDRMVVFASRLRALLCCPDVPREVCPQAVRYYLELGYVPGGRSILRHVVKLEPGQWLLTRARGGVLETVEGRAPAPAPPDARPGSTGEWIDTLDQAINQAVHRQMVSDVPIGALLSGGVDSSLVTAMMQRHSREPVQTFTVGFSDAATDESTHAAAVARHLGTQHREVRFAPSDLLRYVDTYVEHYDEPLADPSGLPTLAVCELAARSVRVCLGGDGGDELFGGYRYYGYLDRLAPAFHLPGALRRGLGGVLRRVGRPRHRSRLLAAALEAGVDTRAFSLMRSISKDRSLDALLDGPALLSAEALVEEEFGRWPTLSSAERASRFDQRYFLVDDILQKVDVASMAYSLEARVPLLDPEVRRWATLLPPALKRRRGVSKWALRQVLYRYVPRHLVDRPKQGFVVPTRAWFRQELRGYLEEALSPERVRAFGLLRPAGVRAVIDAHLSGRQDTQPLLWALVCLLQWDRAVRQAAPG